MSSPLRCEVGRKDGAPFEDGNIIGRILRESAGQRKHRENPRDGCCATN